MLIIDGSLGEGGGQILRTSLALSLVTQTPFHLKNVRAKRSKPGLQPQHLMSVRAAAQIGQASEVALDNAQYQLEVEPGLTPDGRLRLAFTPRIEYGDLTRSVVVPPDRTDFVIQVEKPSRLFKEMRFEVTLAPNEYLVIGGTDGQPESLGNQAFMNESGRQPVQRLLVAPHRDG